MILVGGLKQTDENVGQVSGSKVQTFDLINMIFKKGRLLAEMKA